MSHSPFARKWKNGLWDSEPVVARFLSNKGGTYKSHAALRSCTSPHVCVMCVVCMG